MVDIPRENYAEKLEILDNYIDQVKDSFEPDILLINSNQEKGMIYWDAEKYDLAIPHYEKVMEVLGSLDLSYYHVAYMLITCNRLNKQWGPSLKWATSTLDNLNNTHSSFYNKLSILNAYSDLLQETGMAFDEKYTPLIDKVILEMGFPPVPAIAPIERIKIIEQEHKNWNHRLMKVDQISKANKKEIIIALKDYISSCDIGWYKNYAAKRLERIENAT